MKIENVNARPAQSFTALKPNMAMDATLFKSILDIKTVKAFGKKYDATVGI